MAFRGSLQRTLATAFRRSQGTAQPRARCGRIPLARRDALRATTQPTHGPRTRRRKTIALVGRATIRASARRCATLAEHLPDNGHESALARGSVLRTSARSRLARADETVSCPAADLVVAIGGDGTMLHAARLAAIAGAPVLGVNRGRLGFLADVSPERMLESVDDALAGRCQPEARMLLEAAIPCDGRATSALALNDVAVDQARDRPHARPAHLDRRRLRQYARRRRVRRRDVDRLHRVRLSCGGPIVQPEPRRAGARADLPAHPVRPADRRGRRRASSNSSSPSASIRAPRSSAMAVLLCELDAGRVRLRIEAGEPQRDAAASARPRLLPHPALEAALGTRRIATARRRSD